MPDVHHRRIGLDAPDTDLGSESQVADGSHQPGGQSETTVGAHLRIAEPIDRIQSDQSLVQRGRTDGVLQQKLEAIRLQGADRGWAGTVPGQQGQIGPVVHSIVDPRRIRAPRYRVGVLGQPSRIDRPVDLDRAREVGHGVPLQSHARDATLLSLDEGSPGSAEWTEDSVGSADAETLQIVPNQMRRVGEDEAVPIVDRTVVGTHPVGIDRLRDRDSTHSGRGGHGPPRRR